MSKDVSKRIAIVGGGPGGLTLARIFQLNGWDVKVYEQEASIDNRSQGGTLDLHRDSGQYALRKANLFDKFRELCRPEGQDARVMDKFGTVYTEEVTDGSNFDRPEIDRHDLRQLLLESLKPDTIKQGYHLRGVEALDHGQHKLQFDNGMTEVVDLLFGADGAW
jgi:2-polyprenyl-6-methoxyphenol hydroxylase-like FAD-dependent oxidoreductase